MSATNSYTDMAELIRDYMRQPIDDYLNQSISINSVTLSCDVYRIADGTSLTSSVFTGCVANDANTQIIVGRNLKVASGVTLIPPYRCKGVFIGSPGVFTNSGTISMTARGASGAGKNIKLVDNYQISATGGSGGAGVNQQKVGNTGASPSSGVLSCAGGGSGGYARNSTSGTSGAGGSGTSFSGGAGGGGTGEYEGATDGSSTGGAGGNSSSHMSGQSDDMGGGAGNPGGNGGGSGGSVAANKGSDGTGGLLVIMANTLNQSGALESKGAKGGDAPNTNYYWRAGGGGSGGGCIVLLSYSSTVTGTNSVSGGAGGDAGTTSGGAVTKNGGAGGTGVYSNLTVSDMILSDPYPLSLALTMEEFLEDIDPESGRLLALMDEDELMYEYNGTRHRAVRTDADLSSFPIPQGEAGTRGVPVGTVISFFGDSAPDGYLACNGAEYNKADYIALSTHLATLSTASQYAGSTSDKFKVPDLRGEFLRGTGTNGHSGQGGGSNVGVHQDATEITNSASENGGLTLFYGTLTSGNISNIRNADKNNTAGSQFSGKSWVHLSKTSGDENDNIFRAVRPTNTSVMYCIKY